MKIFSHLKPSLWLFAILLACGAWQTQAQTVSGKVVDGSNGDPLVGATVREDGTTNGASTDVDGNFTLRVSKSPTTLVISVVGFAEQRVTAAAGSPVSVTMEADAALSEVIVTALGIERQQKTLTYAAQKIDGGDIKEVRDANFVNTLSGKVAGLVVTQAAGGPGSAVRVVLRGNRSIQGNNSALFVVDGVPIDNSVGGGNVGSDFGGYNGSDGVNNLNPDDIESVNVLPGAAAAVLYGSRASNGVILITTKKGKAGRISVDVNSGYVAESPFLLPSLQNDFTQGNGGVSNTTSSGSWGGRGATFPDNIKQFFRTGNSFNNSFSVSGGSEKMTTYMSYTHNLNQGIIPNNDLTRHTFNLRIGNQLSKKLSTDAKITYINQGIDNKVRVGEESGIVQNLYKMPRSVSNESIQTYENANGMPQYWTTSSIYMNPYWTLNKVLNNEDRNRIIAMGVVKYEITPWLNIMGRATLDRYTDAVSRSFANNTLLFAQAGGSYQEGFYNAMERNLEAFITGNNKFGDNISLNYTVGTAVSRRKFTSTFTNANGLLVPNRFDLSFARQLSTFTDAPQREIQSAFATAQLGFKDYLFLDVSGRNDWASTLPPDANSYFYPSVGVNAILSEMLNMKGFLKVRAAWAQVGNDVPQNILFQTYSFQQGGTGGFVSRDNVQPIPDAKPEITTSLEFGADWRIPSNRFGIDLTWYKSNSVNQLLRLALAPGSGFAEQFINAGDIENSGIEIKVTGTPLKSRSGLNWETSLNFARNRNKIIELHPDIKVAFLSGGYGRSAGPVIQEGGSFGDMYGEGWKKDAQGRNLVDANGRPVGSGGGGTKVGNFNPNFIMGWSNTFSFKGISLNVLLDGRFGGTMTSGTEANLAFDGTAAYTTAFRDGGLVLNGVTATGEQNTKAINAESFWTTVSGGRYSWGEFFTYDATNVRIRELMLGYTIPLKSDKIKAVKISLVGRNLAFLYRGKAILDIPGMPERQMNFDPDINLSAGNFQGVEYGSLPSTRTIGVNLQLSF
jgi:TonB-linked SusC/RagA family outer membrane protein